VVEPKLQKKHLGQPFSNGWSAVIVELFEVGREGQNLAEQNANAYSVATYVECY